MYLWGLEMSASPAPSSNPPSSPIVVVDVVGAVRCKVIVDVSSEKAISLLKTIYVLIKHTYPASTAGLTHRGGLAACRGDVAAQTTA